MRTRKANGNGEPVKKQANRPVNRAVTAAKVEARPLPAAQLPTVPAAGCSRWLLARARAAAAN
ncbi:hypothetical protein D3C73_1534900 [compost metagenome]